ncbi:MAG: type IVB secretion system protein IcmH/DotU [Chromatiaceae bacterium]|nr:type IVB secretion system protein IcmH/DotU [Chromatiaceae bacterium]
MPGGRRPVPPAMQAPAPDLQARAAAPSQAERSASHLPIAALQGAAHDNPLVACASELFTVAGQLRGSASHPDPSGLLQGLIKQMRAFEQCARGKGLAESVVLPARYVLCALLDESVLDTPWGSQSIWASKGLLVSFHNETWGGEKFYDALDRLLAFPSGNLQLLELMYLCLAMGFEGRYRVRDGGREQLERVREQLYQTIRAQQPGREPELSPHWRGVASQRDALIYQFPLWVFAGLAGLLLLALFAAYTFALNRDSDPVFLSLSALDKRLPAMPERSVVRTPRPPPAITTAEAPIEPPPGPPPPTLRSLLGDEVATGRLRVVDQPDGQAVIIGGSGLFASASATLQPDYVPLVRRIGEALTRVPGRVLVTGHSDSAPIKTLRFPSNWHLSKARADSVLNLLVEVAQDPDRFTAEGRGASEPLVPENPRDARNRRVEILLIGARPREQT